MPEILSFWNNIEQPDEEASNAALRDYLTWLHRPNKHRTDSETADLRISDVFCGPGGFTLGFKWGLEDEGMQTAVELAADFDLAAIETFKLNHRPRALRRADLTECFSVPLEEAERLMLNLSTPKIADRKVSACLKRSDILLASPPCKGFSNFNNNSRYQDERNQLVIASAGLAIASGVNTYVMENVPEVRSDRSKVLDRSVDLLKAHNYSVGFRVLNSAKFGVPQARRRLFLVASRSFNPEDVFESLMATKVRPPSTVAALTAELQGDEDHLHMGADSNLSAENRARIDYLFDHNIYDLPNAVRPECHQEDHTYPSVYGRMHPDRPAGTLTSGFLSPGRGRFVHPTIRRGLNLRDGARLQSFPDSYIFPPSHGRTVAARMIGDAVPPLVSYWVARAVAKMLKAG